MKKNILLLLLIILCCLKLDAQYYNTAFGLNGTQLKTALHNIIKNHNTQSWPLWSYFYTTDDRNGNQVWDIYSDKPGNTPPYQFVLGNNQCGTYNQESDCYNHEHSWPSTFFNDATPMRTDLHHVYPTDGYVNNKRSNYPLGVVSTASWTSQNGSKLGNSASYPGYTDKVFEPIDSFKGDLARTYFYMSTRYESEDAGWGNWNMANGAQLTQDAIDLLMTWHHNDPVSQKEVDRNEAIFLVQNNRNPFIDYPMFADCIWGTADCISIGLQEKELQSAIRLFPVPAHELLAIETPETIDIATICIYDFTGRMLLQLNQETGHRHKESLNISTLPSGNYYIRINTSAGVFTKIFSKN